MSINEENKFPKECLLEIYARSIIGCAVSTVKTEKSTTISDFKHSISTDKMRFLSIPEHMVAVFGGIPLPNNKCLSDFHIMNESKLHCAVMQRRAVNKS